MNKPINLNLVETFWTLEEKNKYKIAFQFASGRIVYWEYPSKLCRDVISRGLMTGKCFGVETHD